MAWRDLDSDIAEMFGECQSDTSPLGMALSRVSTRVHFFKKHPRLLHRRWARKPKAELCRNCHPNIGTGKLGTPVNGGRRFCPLHKRKPAPHIAPIGRPAHLEARARLVGQVMRARGRWG